MHLECHEQQFVQEYRAFKLQHNRTASAPAEYRQPASARSCTVAHRAAEFAPTLAAWREFLTIKAARSPSPLVSVVDL